MTWRQGSAAFGSVLVLIAILFSLISPASAQQIIDIGNVGGNGGLRLEFWDSQSGPQHDGTFPLNPNPVRAQGEWTDDEINAVTRGASYWWEVLGERNALGRDLTFSITRNGEIYEDGVWYALGTSSESPELILNGVRSSTANHVWAFGETALSPWASDNLINFQDLDGHSFSDRPGGPLDNGGGLNTEAVMIHEMTHALGMITAAPFAAPDNNPSGQPPEGQLRLFEQQIIDADGAPISPGQSYSANTPFFFNGANSLAVYGRPVPLNTRSIEKGHIGIDPLLLSHQPFRNYIFLTEVELAMMQDLGYQIDRQEHFGRSYYQDGNGGSESNHTGFHSEKMYGVGLHLFSHDHVIVQAADLTANGYAGTGIRVDGVMNTVVIDPDVTITTNGDYGTGILVSNGYGNSIVHRGTILAGSATEDAEGTGVLIDFGMNLLGGNSRSSATPVDYRNDHQPVIGYLVDQLDITGAISTPHGDAIRINSSAAVREINIMTGATIDGNIRVNSLSSTLDQLEATQINFGHLADEQGRRTNEIDRNFHLHLSGEVDSNATINILGGIDDDTGVQFDKSVRARSLNVTPAGRVLFQDDVQISNILNDGDVTLAEDATISMVQNLTNNGDFRMTESQITLYIKMTNNGTFISDGGTIRSGFGPADRTLLFAAGSTYQGINDNIQILRGWLEIHGDVHSRDGNIYARDSITVYDGGRLSGTPQLESRVVQVHQGGTLAPGNSIGTMNIMGDLVLDGNLDLEFTSTAITDDIDRIIVTSGVAWIGTDSFATRGTFDFTGDRPETPEAHEIGRRYTVIQTEQPDQLLIGYRPQTTDHIDDRRMILRTDTDVAGFYSPGAREYYAYVGRDVPYVDIAQTKNEREVASFLDDIKLQDDNSDEGNQIQWLRDTLDLMPDESDVRSAFRQMSGEIYASVPSMILQQMQSGYYRLAAAARNDSSLCGPQADLSATSGIYGSMTGFGTGGNVRSDAAANGYSFGAGGTQVQIGYGQQDVLVGGYYNFTGGSLRGEGTAGIEIHDFGGFLMKKGELTHLLVGVGGGFQTTNVNRSVAFGNTSIQLPITERLSSNASSGLLGAYGEYALNLEFSGGAIRPFAGLSYAAVGGSNVDEGDTALALDGTVNALDSFRSLLGMDLSLCLPAATNTVLDLRAMWAHEFQNQRTGRFLQDRDGTLVAMTGVDLGSDFAVLGTTLSHEFWGNRCRFFGGYDLIANSRQTLHTGSGGLEFLW